MEQTNCVPLVTFHYIQGKKINLKHKTVPSREQLQVGSTAVKEYKP
jgi:hypothetical protein